MIGNKLLLTGALKLLAIVNPGEIIEKKDETQDNKKPCLATRLSHWQARQANILLITADDLGLQLGCYGDKIARTSNLDHLAREGIKFNNAYVTQASCSASRSSIFTGLFPHQNGQVGLTLGFSMLNDIPNVFSLFHKNGYRTGIIGKFHVEPVKDFDFDYQPDIHHRDVVRMAEGARTFIKETKKPFLLSVNYVDPHKSAYKGPNRFPDRVNGIPENTYTTKDVKAFSFQGITDSAQKNHIAGYYNCIARLDIGIGLLMKVFREEKILDNTIVIFIGDNGPPFTRAKQANYEASVKVPFIVRYPEKIKKGLVSSSLVSSIDILPTLLDLTGIQNTIEVTGKSLAPIFSNPEYDIREYLFTEFTFHKPSDFFPRRTVRNARFKLIHNLLYDKAKPITSTGGCEAYEYSQAARYHGSKVQRAFELLANPPEYELYDLENDPNEFENIASNPKYKEVLNELKIELRKWQKKTHDPLLYPYIRNTINEFDNDKLH